LTNSHYSIKQVVTPAQPGREEACAGGVYLSNAHIRRKSHATVTYRQGSSFLSVARRIEKDQVVHLVSTNEDFIPQQQISTKKVTLTTATNPIKSGFIEVQQNKQPIKMLAYNYDRTESDLSYIDVKEYFSNASNIFYLNSVNEAFQTMSNKYKTTSLWQLFLLFALLFLIIEILLLKFLKP